MRVGSACRRGLGPWGVLGFVVAALALNPCLLPVDPAAAAIWSTWSNVASSGPAATSQAAEAYDQATSTDVLFHSVRPDLDLERERLDPAVPDDLAAWALGGFDGV